jgi:hypothetical protein
VTLALVSSLGTRKQRVISPPWAESGSVVTWAKAGALSARTVTAATPAAARSFSFHAGGSPYALTIAASGGDVVVPK